MITASGDPTQLTLTELGAAYRARQLSPVEATRGVPRPDRAARSRAPRVHHRHRRARARPGARGGGRTRPRARPRSAARRADRTIAAGLPIGLQIIGAPGADAAVLRLAAAYEAATR